MKKYLIIILLFFVFFIVLFNKRSYAYVDCSNVIVKPEGVTTLNLKNYLNKFEYKEIYYVCSYDCCYNVKNGDKDDIVNKLKSAGIDQNNIEMILKIINSEAENK